MQYFIKADDSNNIVVHSSSLVLANKDAQADWNPIPKPIQGMLQNEDGVYLCRYINGSVVPKEEAVICAEMTEIMKPRKVAALSAQCNTAIVGGIVAVTTKGKEPFSLSTEDQLNIQNLTLQLVNGKKSVLYHSDGHVCRRFAPDEFMVVSMAAIQHVTYHQTYFNHMKAWVSRLTNANEIEAIQYGDALPEDLQKNLNDLLGWVQ